MAVILGNGPSSVLALPRPPRRSANNRRLHFGRSINRSRILSGNAKILSKSSRSRICSSQRDGAEKSDAVPEDPVRFSVDNAAGSLDDKMGGSGSGSSFLSKLGIVLGIAAVITLVLIGVKPPNLGTSIGIQFLRDGTSSTLVSPSAAFSFRAFGFTVLLPEYAPGWIYFWLLMAAGCGLFISEEALNIWVGVTLARLICLDGTWKSLVDSFSRNAPYIFSTVLWVYWGVCISDMIPFYFGKMFRQSSASDDVLSKLGVGEEKAKEISSTVQRYGNLIGFVERFSLGVRNPTAFLAGAMGISPECFFAGVCCGGLITLPVQLVIGFLLRERPVFALATVATVVGIWTVFPYALAVLTALILYLRSRYSS
ncbi:uncharacterized protein LOC131023691 [Salvia miltiorrhiza]|uniref:uncharacterized protein LOC131023691 n=1 Tax=Salvia miltiorrhiza TaxID=226208 RepID=UPI0025ACF187|nr:uncharacterized protein LOC131023691 [Salvia miltiorrhiza]